MINQIVVKGLIKAKCQLFRNFTVHFTTQILMCTVTYIPKENNTFILTSNRDEAVGRTTLVPSFYDIDGVKMLFPKDAVAGGTWIGISEKSRMICLLNGGFENHVKVQDYKMSRGIVVKRLLKADDLSEAINNFDYQGIEPFTIVAIDWSNNLKATELVWDGYKAHITVLDKEPKIWSSSTLYLKTVSVTQIEKEDIMCSMSYHDLQKKEVHVTEFEMITA